MKIKKAKNKKVEKMYDKAMKELKAFFKIKWKGNKPGLVLVPDRKTIDLLQGRKSEPWGVGWARNNTVFLLAPKNYEKESIHKYSDETYYALLKHELVHIFVQAHLDKFDKPLYPRWISEGLAVFLSGQNKFKTKPTKFKQFLDFYEKDGKEIYNESGFAIELLFNKFGREKMLLLIKSASEFRNKAKFNRLFKKIYGFLPSYKKFNEMLK